jgi:hypothetical protein
MGSRVGFCSWWRECVLRQSPSQEPSTDPLIGGARPLHADSHPHGDPASGAPRDWAVWRTLAPPSPWPVATGRVGHHRPFFLPDPFVNLQCPRNL